MLHKFQLAGIGGSSSTVVGHVPKCMLLVLFCIKPILVNVYSVLSCPYLHCHALALANGDHLLLLLGN